MSKPRVLVFGEKSSGKTTIIERLMNCSLNRPPQANPEEFALTVYESSSKRETSTSPLAAFFALKDKTGHRAIQIEHLPCIRKKIGQVQFIEVPEPSRLEKDPVLASVVSALIPQSDLLLFAWDSFVQLPSKAFLTLLAQSSLGLDSKCGVVLNNVIIALN